jgi:hypothetical protein
MGTRAKLIKHFTAGARSASRARSLAAFRPLCAQGARVFAWCLFWRGHVRWNLQPGLFRSSVIFGLPNLLIRGIEETQIHPGLPPESTRRFAFLWNVASAAATRTHEKNFSTRRGAGGSKRRDALYIGLFSNKFNNPISFFADLFMHVSRLYTYICKICCSGGFKEPLLFLLRAHLMSWNSAR